MKISTVRRIAHTLNTLALVMLICNYLLLYLVPAAVLCEGEGLLGGVWNYLSGSFFPGEDDIAAAGLFGSLLAWGRVWRDIHHLVPTLFLIVSGLCTAAILRQGRKVLQTILHGEPFSTENAAHLRRSAFYCFVIAAAALVRAVSGAFLYRSFRPLTNYNALFAAIFTLAGLLCLVMAALFRQAAEMKVENDLII